MTGRVIVLNGGSSSGKTTLARHLQTALDGMWFMFGIDLFLWLSPMRMHDNPDGIKVIDGIVNRGQRFTEHYDHWIDAVAGFARSGSNVVLDEVFLAASFDQERWRRALRDVPTLWVGVRCPADEAERRELERRDRNIGIARVHADSVHDGVVYDVVVDTSTMTTEQAGAVILEHRIAKIST